MARRERSVKIQRHRSGLWFANIGPPKNGRATPRYAPRAEVRTEAEAWRWLDRELAAMAAGGPTRRDVYQVCQEYLRRAEDRVEKGLMPRDEYGRICSRLTLAWEWRRSEGASRLGDLGADALDAALVKEAVESWLAAGYMPSYLANVVRALKTAFAWATRDVAGRTPVRMLAANPIADARLPIIPHSPERFAGRREIAAFLRFFRAYADGACRGYKGGLRRRTHGGRESLECRFDRLTILAERLMIHSGCRPGEACKARWSDVRWDAGVTPTGLRYAKIVIPPGRWKSGGKTGRSRTIYVSPILTRALRREFERPDRHPVHVFAHRCGPRDRLKGHERETGAPWNSGALAAKIRKVRRLAVAAGIDLIEDEGPNRLVNYRWRHTGASEMLMLGIDVATVAELLGTSADMIRKTYGHLLDSHLARAAAAFHAGRRRG